MFDWLKSWLKRCPYKVVTNDGSVRKPTRKEKLMLWRAAKEWPEEPIVGVAVGPISKEAGFWFSVDELEAGRIQGVMGADGRLNPH